jgi:hypothetical protein
VAREVEEDTATGGDSALLGAIVALLFDTSGEDGVPLDLDAAETAGEGVGLVLA